MADNIMVGSLPAGGTRRIGISDHGCERFVESSLAQVGVTYTKETMEEILVPLVRDARGAAVDMFRGKTTIYMIVANVMLTIRYTNDEMLLIVTMHDLDIIEGSYSGIAMAKKKLELFIEKANRREAKALAAMKRNQKGYRKLYRRIRYGRK